MTRTITIPKSVNYLSDYLDTLPHNCLFDKGKTAAGGTTLALEAKVPYIICVPFVSMIENKLAQYNQPNSKDIRFREKIYGFYASNNTKAKLTEYIKGLEGQAPKIMVTYDSLEKLMKWINPKEYCILIDELHLLFTEYSYREAAIKGVLNSYKAFKNYCFMTATMLEDEFLLEELKDEDRVTAEWEEVHTVNVLSVKCKNGTRATTVRLIKEFLSGTVEGNAYFFVNSVSYISEIVDYINEEGTYKLTDDNTRVIYSQANATKLPIRNGHTTDAPKKINFLTSTAFEGSDIYDSEGKIIIISDASRHQTLTDISTRLQQIAGRIRNTKYNKEIHHLYTQTRYSDLTYEEMLEKIEDTKNETTNLIEASKIMTPRNRESQMKLVDVRYISLDADKNLVFDANKVKIDLYNFKITKVIYSLKVNLHKEYAEKGFNAVAVEDSSMSITIKKGTANSFKDYVTILEDAVGKPFDNIEDIRNEAIEKYPYILKAIEVLGFEGIKEMKYHTSNIQIKLTASMNTSEEFKIYKALNDKLNIKIGEFYSNKQLKDAFVTIYKELNKKGAKASEIDKYYEVKPSKRRDGKDRIDGYTIIRPHIIRR